MPRVRKSRLKRGAVRFDPTALRELVDDGRVFLARGLVVQEGASHYEIVDGGADVLVDVELQPSGVRCTARLGGLGGGAGRGVWAIPPVGAEVVLGVPDGELEVGPVIIACESTGQVPDGLGPTTYVVCVPAGGQVLVHDGTASQTVPLATKADVQAVKSTVDALFDSVIGHVHLSAAPASPTGPPQAFDPSPAPMPPAGGSVSPIPAPSGTSVLKAK